MDSLTDPLKELVRLSKLATPGPWDSKSLEEIFRGGYAGLGNSEKLPAHTIVYLLHNKIYVPDAEFCAEARNAIPSLEALLSRHEKLVAAVKSALEDSETGDGWGPDVTVAARLRAALDGK